MVPTLELQRSPRIIMNAVKYHYILGTYSSPVLLETLDFLYQSFVNLDCAMVYGMYDVG